MRRYRFLAVIVVVLLCLSWAGPALAAKSYSAERFDVLLDVQADGSLVVTETIQFQFVGGPFTYAFRDLAFTGLDEIDRLQASMDGAALPRGTGAGQVEVVAGHPLKVTWHFAPTFDASHDFVLTYRVQGVIRKEASADALIWRAIPEAHDYDIERSTITLRYPASIGLVGAPALSGAAASQESGEGQVAWTTGRIGADDSLVVTARFAPGSLVQAPPAWQARQAEQRQQAARALPVGLVAGLLTLALGVMAMVSFLGGRRHTGAADRGAADRAGLAQISTPPDPSPPGLAVRLAGGSTPVLATLFDLAERELLRIEESGRGLLGRKRYSLQRLPSEGELRPHEEGLLRALFEEKSGEKRDSIPLSQAPRRLSGRSKWYREPLDAEMEAAGWLDPQRKATRTGLMVAAIAAILGGGAVMIAGFVVAGSAAARGAGSALTVGAAAAGAGGALFLLGIAAMVVSAVYSPLSDRGEEAAASWKGFAAYLKGITRGREPFGAEVFERYLPFAAGMGLGEKWAKYVQKQGYATIPTWFRAAESEIGDFDDVVVVIAHTHASFSSGSGGAAGAAGASGGGASGAG